MTAPRPITQADVEKVAALARLELTDAEKDEATAYLGEIAQYVARLADVPTDGVALFESDHRHLKQLRPDAATAFPERHDLVDDERFEDDLLVTQGIFSDDHENS